MVECDQINLSKRAKNHANNMYTIVYVINSYEKTGPFVREKKRPLATYHSLDFPMQLGSWVDSFGTRSGDWSVQLDAMSLLFDGQCPMESCIIGNSFTLSDSGSED